MWILNTPNPVKLIIGILAYDQSCLESAVETLENEFSKIDSASDIWTFTQTEYYKDETGENILRQFVSFEKLISPDQLASIKCKTNKLEEKLAKKLNVEASRPINLDPGIIEPSKLILASAKNFSHRIYIGKKIWAEVTLNFSKGIWKKFDYTFPDYQQQHYHDFFSKVREKLVSQLKEI